MRLDRERGRERVVAKEGVQADMSSAILSGPFDSYMIFQKLSIFRIYILMSKNMEVYVL